MTEGVRWQEFAACKGSPIEWWFPAHESGGGDHYYQARKLCAACCVRSACFVDAVADPAVRFCDALTGSRGGSGGGFRAGLTAGERARQRQSIHRRRKRAA